MEIGVFGCACTHAMCFWYCVLLYATVHLSLYFNYIFSLGWRISHSFYQTIPYLILSLSTILHLLSVFHCFLSVSMSLYLLCCKLLCDMLPPLPLYAAGDRKVLTMNHLHLPLWHAPFSSTNVTRIWLYHRYPVQMFLALIGIPTNDIMSIVVNLIAKTLHTKNREGFFQLDRQLFNTK